METEFAVVSRMQGQVNAWEAARDRRAIFLGCYTMMTRNMLLAVRAGEFEDGAWVDALLHRFADYYFAALDACNRQAAVPAVWRAAFDADARPQTHVLQNLLLGVNAHICYDLVFALVDTLTPTWHMLDDDQRAARYRDHCRVNDIIYRTIDSVQDEIVERYDGGMALVDIVFARLDEWALHRLIAGWREEVWHDALRLLACISADENGALCAAVEERSLRRAQAVTGQRGLSGLLDLL